MALREWLRRLLNLQNSESIIDDEGHPMWVTREGTRILMSEMSDRHLLYAIRYMQREVAKFVAQQVDAHFNMGLFRGDEDRADIVGLINSRDIDLKRIDDLLSVRLRDLLPESYDNLRSELIRRYNERTDTDHAAKMGE